MWETEALQASAAGSCLNADEGLSPFLLTLTLHLPGKDVGVIVVHLLSGGVRLSIMDVFDLCWQTRTYDRPAGPRVQRLPTQDFKKSFKHKETRKVKTGETFTVKENRNVCSDWES